MYDIEIGINDMNIIDIIILIILAIFCIKGFFRGFIMEAFTLVGLILAYVIALREMSALAALIGRAVRVPPWLATALSFFLIFIIVIVFCRIMAGALRKLMRWSLLGSLDRGGGVIIGIIKGALVTSLLALLISMIPVTEEMRQIQRDSYLFGRVRNVAPAVFNVIKRAVPQTKTFYDEVRETVAKTTEAVEDHPYTNHLEQLQEELDKQVKKDE